jgi:hypothetical protein
MIHWWNTLGLRGKLLIGAGAAMLVNGVMFLNDHWSPRLLILAAAFLVGSFFVPDDD